MKYCYFLFALFIFITCSSDKNSDQAQYSLSVVPEDDTLKFSDLYDEYKLIHLKGAIVANVTDIVQIGDKYVIKCKSYESYEKRNNAAVVNLFSINGDFIKPIVSVGRASNEVLNVQVIRHNEYTNTLDVLCNYGQSIYQYSTENYELIGKIDLDKEEIISAESFLPIDKERYIVYKQFPYTNGQDYKLYVYNSKLNCVENKLLLMDEELAEKLSFTQNNNLFGHNGKILFYESFLQKVYQYSEGLIIPYIDFKENRFSVSDGFLDKASTDLVRLVSSLKESSYIWNHTNLFAFKDKIISFYTFNNQLYHCVMNLATQECKSYKYLSDDMIFNITVDNNVSDYDLIKTINDRAIYVIEPSVMKERLDGSIKINNNCKYILDLPDDSNPLLLIVK
jgi:hypothetical protein